MSNLRQKLVDKGAVKTKIVHCVGEDGEQIAIEVHALMAGERGDVLTECLLTREGEDGEDVTTTDLAKLGPRLVIAGAYDPDTHERIFGDEDRELVAQMDAAFLDPIVNGVSQLSGISAAADKKAEKNSGGTAGSDSATPSPANSE
jgi:hypothetical protein